MIVPSTNMAEALERRLSIDQQDAVDAALARVRAVADVVVPDHIGWPVRDDDSRTVRVVSTDRYTDESGDPLGGQAGEVVMAYTGAGPEGRIVQMHVEDELGTILAALVLQPERAIEFAYDLLVVAQHALTDAVIS